jgi:hypothetical protein
MESQAQQLQMLAEQLELPDRIRGDLYERFMRIDLSEDNWQEQAKYVLQLRDLLKIAAGEVARLLPLDTEGES